MPKKIIDFMEEVAKLLGPDQEKELEPIKNASDLSEVELTDGFIDSFHNNLLTRDRAKSDDEVRQALHTNHFAHFYDTTDKQVIALVSNLSEDRQKQVKSLISESKSKEAYELLPSLFSDELEARSEDKDTAARLKQAQEENEKLRISTSAEIEKAKKETEDKLKEIQDGQKRDKLQSIIKDRVFNQKLVENLPGGKTIFAKLISDQLQDKYILVQEGDDIAVRKQDGETLVDVYENNEKLTFDKALEPLLKDFLKKSPDQPDPPVPPQPGQPSKAVTLMDMQRTLAQKEAKKELDNLVASKAG